MRESVCVIIDQLTINPLLTLTSIQIGRSEDDADWIHRCLDITHRANWKRDRDAKRLSIGKLSQSNRSQRRSHLERESESENDVRCMMNFSFHGRMWRIRAGQDNFIYSWHINSDVWHSLGRRTIMQLICSNWIANETDSFFSRTIISSTHTQNIYCPDVRWFLVYFSTDPSSVYFE